MDRRKFLKYSSLAAAGFAFAACSQPAEEEAATPEAGSDATTGSETPAVDFGPLEKTDITLGIIPLTDCAPLVIGVEKGIYAK
ncbi:MAG: twin-arginine translocation signal domain-containing protein, partial [Oscillatoriales cyanobacterium]